MKKLLFQKFMMDNFKMFSIIIMSIGSIVWIIQSVNFLDFVTEDGHSFRIYAYYSLLNFPKVIQRILPFVFFITLFYQIVHYEENNQLLIFWIHGIKKIQLVNVIIVYSILFSLIQIILGGFISPKSKDMARSFIRGSNLDFFSSIINPGKFVDAVEDLTIFIEKENEMGVYENIFLKDDSSSNLNNNPDNESSEIKSQIIFAKTARLISTKNNRYFKLFDGKLLKINNKKIDTFEFKSIDFDLSKFNTKTTTYPKIQEVPARILVECLIYIHKDELQKFKDTDYLSCNKNSTQAITQELLLRFYIPIFIPFITIIVCLLILKSKDDVNYRSSKFFLFILIFLIIVISEVSLKYSTATLIGLSFFILFPIFGFFLTYFTLIMKFRYKD